MSNGVILSEELETADHSLAMQSHPFGKAFTDTCPICKYLITPYNAARYCHCNVYAHGSCIVFSVGDCSPFERKWCQICKSPYNFVFEDRATLRPLSSLTPLKIGVLVLWAGMLAGLCLLLIQLINYSIENETTTEELSYFLFSTYLALFVLVTLACLNKIVLQKVCTAVGIEPYYRNVIYVEQPQERSCYDRDRTVTESAALTTKELVGVADL